MRADLSLLGQTHLHSNLSPSLVCARTEDLLVLHDVTGNTRSVLSLIRAALPRLPLEDNTSLVWKDYVPGHLTSRWFGLAGLAARMVPRPGLAMSYTLHKEAATLVVEGSSFRKDKCGQPVMRTRIAFDAERGPLWVQVRYGNQEESAFRLPAQAHLALVFAASAAAPGGAPPPRAPTINRQYGRLN